MQQLVIVGAGGFGREILFWAQSSLGRQSIKGYLDDSEDVSRDVRLRAPVIGTIRDYNPQTGDVFVCAIGNPLLRQRTSEVLMRKGAVFISVVHTSAIVTPSTELGSGVVVCPHSLLSANATLGVGSVVYYHSSVDHDVVVGPWCQISGHCDIAGGAVLGARVFLGSHVTVLPGVHIGDDAVVGAGAVVVHNVPAGMTVMGIPARAIR